VPLVGPVIVTLKNAARWILRGALSRVLGSQDEFNAAVANILFEFTRRASTPAPLELNPAAVDEAINRLSLSDNGSTRSEVLLLAREIQVLREQVRAAQLSAAENERLVSELVRRVSELEAKSK
jgi:hypothetical protein